MVVVAAAVIMTALALACGITVVKRSHSGETLTEPANSCYNNGEGVRKNREKCRELTIQAAETNSWYKLSINYSGFLALPVTMNESPGIRETSGGPAVVAMSGGGASSSSRCC